MKSLILCRERLERLLKVLDRRDGTASIRDLRRTFGIYEWEVTQAEELGWLLIYDHKPWTGRPSRLAKKLSITVSAKLPPRRYHVPNEITIRHCLFAARSTGLMKGGRMGLRAATATYAYLETFPEAKSVPGAAASASRLMKRSDIRLLRRWFYGTTGMKGMLSPPATISEALRALHALDL
jgi:hypothetical protein